MSTEQLKLFLSHSGLDSSLSLELQSDLERAFQIRGFSPRIFNTSTPEDRFEDLRSILTAGATWRQEYEKYKKRLEKYLEENLRTSDGYLLLVTPQSLKARSEWIQFEIDLARSKAMRERQSFFFPCVAAGAKLTELPREADEFQGLDVSSPRWLDRFIRVIEATRGKKA
jgi:hypothetical protein